MGTYQLTQNAAEVQILIEQIRVSVILAVEIKARLHLGICCLGKRESHGL